MRSLLLGKAGVGVSPSVTLWTASMARSDSWLGQCDKIKSCTLAGFPFSAEHDHFLQGVKLVRGYKTDVWVPLATAQALRLSLRTDADAPVRIPYANGDALYYHSSQFKDSLGTMQRRWDRFSRRQRATESGVDAEGGGAGLEVGDAPGEYTPLCTNGERFKPAVEREMLARGRRHAYQSRYWATPQEAAYLYRSPFHASHLNVAAHRVGVWIPFAAKPVYYYNVTGTLDVAKFTPDSCQRYDPYNYSGRFYRPFNAVQLKRCAIAYGCMDQPQWITPMRAQWLGVSLRPDATPAIVFSERRRIVTLVNVKMTGNVKRVQEQAFMRATHFHDEEGEDKMLVF